MQAVRRPKILPLLRERIRQPREAAHLHSDGEILAFHMAGTDLRRIGVAHDWDLLRMRHVGRAVPALAFGILRVDFDQLREVAAVAECSRNRAAVGLESIGGDLEALAAGRMAQTLDKGVRGGLSATAKGEVQNQLGVPLDSDEAVGIADAVIVRFKGGLIAFLLLNEGPDFVTLNVLHWDVDDQAAHEPFALLASFHQNAHEGIDVQIGNALRAPQTVSLDQEPEGQHDALLGNVGPFQRGLVVLGVGLAAHRAAEALKAIAVGAKALTSNLTVRASHRSYGSTCNAHNESIICLGG